MTCPARTCLKGEPCCHVELRNNPGWPKDSELPLEFIQWVLDGYMDEAPSYDMIKELYMRFKSVRNGAW